MSSSVQTPPTVRLLLPCGEAYFVPDDEVWVVRDPWAVVRPPEGRTFPFRLEDVWLYAQLIGGRGTAELCIEAAQLMEGTTGGGTRRHVGIGPSRHVDLTTEHPLVAVQLSFRLKQVPFRAEGQYEFRIVAATDDGYQALSGQTAIIRAVDTRREL